MPRIKKAPLTNNVELQPVLLQETNPSIPLPALETPVSPKKAKKKDKPLKKIIASADILPEKEEPLVEVRKPKFKEVHTKDSYWLENDIYQTITDMTQGDKVEKARIINKALKDYFKKNKIQLKTLRAKEKKS